MKNQIKNISIVMLLVLITIYLWTESDILYLTAPIISKKFNLKGDLNKDKLYNNLYAFLNRLEDKFIKLMVKITITDHSSKKRIVSLTKFIYVNTSSKNDIQAFINHSLSKFNKYLDHYHPKVISGLFVDYLPINETNYFENSLINP